MTSELFDAGLQPERTQLAWRRTALAIGVGSLLSLRVFPGVLGTVWAMLPGFVGLVFAGWLWGEGHRRYRAFARSVVSRRPSGAGGGAMLALVLFAVAFGSLALVLVAVRA